MNGRAAAPPAMACRVGVSTSTKRRALSVSRQALGQQREPLGEDGKLAGFRAAELAVDADDVAQIEALRKLPIVAHLLLAYEQLDLAGHVADVDELQLSLVTMQHDAAGGTDLRPGHFAGALIGQPFAEVEIGAGRVQIWQSRFPTVLCAIYDFDSPRTNVRDWCVIIEARAPRVVA
jgi:hypothetical protein